MALIHMPTKEHHEFSRLGWRLARLQPKCWWLCPGSIRDGLVFSEVLFHLSYRAIEAESIGFEPM